MASVTVTTAEVGGEVVGVEEKVQTAGEKRAREEDGGDGADGADVVFQPPAKKAAAEDVKEGEGEGEGAVAMPTATPPVEEKEEIGADEQRGEGGEGGGDGEEDGEEEAMKMQEGTDIATTLPPTPPHDAAAETFTADAAAAPTDASAAAAAAPSE
jgi:hypothetical protein